MTYIPLARRARTILSRRKADDTRRKADDTREETGATDPILVIAAIAVSLVLLVGGSYAVSGIITSGNDLNAQGDLEKVATTQDALSAATDGLYVYDNHRDSEHRMLEKPGTDTGVVGFTPTAGGRLIVDVNGRDWVATSTSKSGTVFMRSSEQKTAVEVGTAVLPSAAGAGGYALTVDIPAEALPDSFTVVTVEAMVDAVDSDLVYFAADATDLPGYGSPSAPAAPEEPVEAGFDPSQPRSAPDVFATNFYDPWEPGVPGALNLRLTGNPRPTLSIVSAPEGFVLDSETLSVRGTPTRTGSHSITLRVENTEGARNMTYGVLSVNRLKWADNEQPPAVQVGQTLRWAPKLEGGAALTGLRVIGGPHTLSVYQGQIQGAVWTAGTYTARISVSNQHGPIERVVTFTILPASN